MKTLLTAGFDTRWSREPFYLCPPASCWPPIGWLWISCPKETWICQRSPANFWSTTTDCTGMWREMSTWYRSVGLLECHKHSVDCVTVMINRSIIDHRTPLSSYQSSSRVAEANEVTTYSVDFLRNESSVWWDRSTMTSRPWSSHSCCSCSRNRPKNRFTCKHFFSSSELLIIVHSYSPSIMSISQNVIRSVQSMLITLSHTSTGT